MKEVSDNDFHELVLKNETVSVVDFWAFWCVPCKSLISTLDELENYFKGQIDFFKMDVDQNFEIPQIYLVRSVPTLLVFKEGDVVECIVGVQPKGKLINILDNYIT